MKPQRRSLSIGSEIAEAHIVGRNFRGPEKRGGLVVPLFAFTIHGLAIEAKHSDRRFKRKSLISPVAQKSLRTQLHLQRPDTGRRSPPSSLRDGRHKFEWRRSCDR